jgi:catechol 2,3-dioxygenase-like lactoylglutathione lyase family enzyme
VAATTRGASRVSLGWVFAATAAELISLISAFCACVALGLQVFLMRLPTPSNIDRRGAISQLSRTLLTLAASGLALPTLPALAAYTIVPSGSVSEKQARLAEVEKLFKATPDDPYLSGERAQLDYDIEVLKKNREYAQQKKNELAAGQGAFPQSLRIGVPDMAAALTFWTLGAGGLVLSTRLDPDGANVTRVGFGSQSFDKEDGAKFALELVERYGGGMGYGSDDAVLQYVQLGLPQFRLSRAMANGAEILSAYGWTEAVVPGGLPIRVKIDETRRDPFELVAIRVSDMGAAVRHYESLGMSKVDETIAGRKVQLGGSYGISFKSGNALEPEKEPGSVLMSFGDPALSTGLLLCPPKKRKAKLSLGAPPIALTIVGKPPEAGSRLTSPDGITSEFVPLEEFEKGLGVERVVSFTSGVADSLEL